MAHLNNIFCEFSRRLATSVLVLFAASVSIAADIEVTVLAKDGEPVPNVAVYVQAEQDSPLPAPATKSVMDQIDTRFIPHLLIVQTGTEVEFPNSDIVAHHVYSFSRPNNFMLPLYKGDLQPQISFDQEGVVTLGCNIHDHMLAYILVVNSRTFGKTNYNGKVLLSTDNPDGLTVTIWSPRIKTGEQNLIQTVNAGRSAQVTFSLTEKLRPQHSDDSEALSWNEY